MTRELPLPRRQIMSERMRMAQVRKPFGLALDAARQDDPRAFYVACARYLEHALNRLHAQDQRIIDKLTARVDADDQDSRSLLADFDASLAASRSALKELLQALADFEQTQIDQPAFEAAARRFMDVFLNILAARRHSSQHLEEQHFNLTDWEEVAGVTTDSQAAERALFQTVCAVAPPGLSPEDFQVGPPPA
jgi:hypothetical protein